MASVLRRAAVKPLSGVRTWLPWVVVGAVIALLIALPAQVPSGGKASGLSPLESPPLGTDLLGRPYLPVVVYAFFKTVRIAGCALILGLVLGWTSAISGVLFERVTGGLGELAHASLSALPPPLLAVLFGAFAARTGHLELWLIGALALIELQRAYRSALRTSLRVKSSSYALGAQALGTTSRYLVRHYYLPEVWLVWKPVLLLEFSELVAIEATVSFLGFGAPSLNPSLGRLIADGRHVVSTAPWLLAAPALLIVLILGGGLLALLNMGDPESRKEVSQW